jgi:hypothetical protein
MSGAPATSPGIPGTRATEPSSGGSSRANGNAGYDTDRRSDHNIGWIGIMGVIGLGGLFRPNRDRANDNPGSTSNTPAR